MSAEWEPQSAESWKISLPCNREEGEALARIDPDLGMQPEPVLMTSEPDPTRPDEWRLDVYLGQEPDPELIARVRALAPSSAGAIPVVQKIADEDWVTLSQGFLAPIRAGRFFVHTAAHADAIPAEATAFRIEAARAFGTGHHETTAGCLEALDQLATDGRHFGRVADIGTGTGLLAFAAHALWPDAAILATDIDPVAIEVTADNMVVNGLPAGAITLVTADGMDDPAIRAAAPFDLIVANILAGPLITLAPDLTATLARNGTIVLAGLLASQADDVLAAYRLTGMQLAGRLDRGDWSILSLTAGDVNGA